MIVTIALSYVAMLALPNVVLLLQIIEMPCMNDNYVD